MTQVRRWKQLIRPGITAIVGAGGKTTVLRKLVEYGLLTGVPTMVTTTTKLYETQVALWNPYYGDSFEHAEHHCSQSINMGRCGAWFSGVSGTKVLSVAPSSIDDMSRVHPNWSIVVEADGAKEKWIKAPKTMEPVIPELTTTTIGVVNLQALGMPIEEEHIHNIELVMDIVERGRGAIITPSMLGKLVLHPQGLFQYSKGDKILFGTGYDTVPHRYIDAFLEELTGSNIKQIYLADGYRESCEIKQVLQWR